MKMPNTPESIVTSDLTEVFNKMIKSFKNDNVVVGIPMADKNRKDQTDDSITNAAILAINEFGSPINNIPPRPVMALGIKAAQDQIAEEFKKCAMSALNTGLSALEVFYQRAGIIASNSIKKTINSQEGFKGPSDATLASRESAGFSGQKALIVTGQMRNAITYVVQRKGI